MSITLTGSNPPYAPLLVDGQEAWETPGWMVTSDTDPNRYTIKPKNYLFRIPICVAKPTKYDRIAVYVGKGAAGKVVRFGLMKHVQQAGPLLIDLGIALAETDDAPAVAVINPSVILSGFYDVLLVSDLDPAGAAAYGFGVLAGYLPAFGNGVYNDATLPGGAFAGAITTAGAYVAAGFPSTIPALDGTYTSAADALPLVSLRRAAV